MAARGRGPPRGEPPGDEPPLRGEGGLVALLSLNLLLLAFFILLTALASVEQQRLVQVVQSLNETFQGRVQATPPEDAEPIGDWPLSQSAGSLDPLGQLFRSSFPLARLELDSEQGEMRLQLPAEQLFPGDGSQPGAGARLLLDSIAAALQAREGAGYEVEFFHGYEPRDRHRLVQSGGADPLLLRAGALVSEMSRRGVGESHLSVGLMPGSGDQVRVVLRVWGQPGEPAAPRRAWQ